MNPRLHFISIYQCHWTADISARLRHLSHSPTMKSHLWPWATISHPRFAPQMPLYRGLTMLVRILLHTPGRGSKNTHSHTQTRNLHKLIPQLWNVSCGLEVIIEVHVTTNKSVSYDALITFIIYWKWPANVYRHKENSWGKNILIWEHKQVFKEKKYTVHYIVVNSLGNPKASFGHKKDPKSSAKSPRLFSMYGFVVDEEEAWW